MVEAAVRKVESEHFEILTLIIVVIDCAVFSAKLEGNAWHLYLPWMVPNRMFPIAQHMLPAEWPHAAFRVRRM